MPEQKGRIVVTVLHEMGTMFWEEADRKEHFRTIAVMPMGYGWRKSKETEVDYCAAVDYNVCAAKEEGARVFILGFGPRMVTWAWTKMAALIIQGSKVKTVLIPLCKRIGEGGRFSNPPINGSLLFVTRDGIVKVQDFGRLPAYDFWTRVANIAMTLDRNHKRQRKPALAAK